jgi:radical SAM protein with 4Fe4S-binding SPASM domain
MNSEPTPLFETIEIETVNRCNGECAFCPVNRHEDTRKYAKMDENVFENIIQQLKDLNYDGRLQIFSNNEPLMDKRICDLVKYAKNELPNSHMSFFTNGTLLDEEKFHLLIPYCDTFCIDIYHNGDNIIPDNIKQIIEICNQNTELKNKVIISMINKKAIRNNRGGQSKNRMFTYKLKSSCSLPFKQLIVRPDGKISLCCNDPLGKCTLGDVTKQPLVEIWNSKEYQKVRENLYKKGRSSISLCEFCDNFGGMGTNNAKNYIFTKTEFKTKWEIIDKLMNGN